MTRLEDWCVIAENATKQTDEPEREQRRAFAALINANSPPGLSETLSGYELMAYEIDTNDAVNRKRSLPLAIAAAFAFILCLIVVIATIRMVGRSPSSRHIADTLPTAEPDESILTTRIVLDGATNLRRDPGAYGSYHVAYAFNEKYPATNAIQQI